MRKKQKQAGSLIEIAINLHEPYLLLNLLMLGADANQIFKTDGLTPIRAVFAHTREHFKLNNLDQKIEYLSKVQKMLDYLINNGASYSNQQNPETGKFLYEDTCDIPLVELIEESALFENFSSKIVNQNLKTNLPLIYMEKAKHILNAEDKEISNWEFTQFQSFLKNGTGFNPDTDHMSIFTYMLWRSVEALSDPGNIRSVFEEIRGYIDIPILYTSGFKDHLLVGKLLDLAFIQIACIRDPKLASHQPFIEKGLLPEQMRKYVDNKKGTRDPNYIMSLSLTPISYYMENFMTPRIPEEISVGFVRNLPSLTMLARYTNDFTYQNKVEQLLVRYIVWFISPDILDNVKKEFMNKIPYQETIERYKNSKKENERFIDYIQQYQKEVRRLTEENNENNNNVH